MAVEAPISIPEDEAAEQVSISGISQAVWTRPERLAGVNLPDPDVQAALGMLDRMVDPVTGRIIPHITRAEFAKRFEEIDLSLMGRIQTLLAKGTNGSGRKRTSFSLRLGASVSTAQALAFGYASRIVESGGSVNGNQLERYTKQIGPVINYARSLHTGRAER